YVVRARSAHTQLLQAIQKEDILERYIAFEQSHSQFFSALVELIHSTGRAVQELKQNVTFHEKTGTYTVAKSVHASISLMRKSMDKARKENAKDPFPEAFEDYHLFAYNYVNDKGETVTMWLLERDGKRASNKELQAFLEENGAELDPILYTNLSGEELERKVNDAWKDGVNYLNGQKVTGFSGATLRSSAYVASMKDAMDDAGLTDMALGLGFGIAAARNKSIIDGKASSSKTKKGTINEQGNDYETEVFLPEEYYKNYRLPSRVEPGVKSLNKFDDLGNLKQTKFYDDYGREKGWIDYTNHGRPNSHSAPHWHEYIYNAEFPLGKKIDHRFDTNPPFNK
ncbi:hypothetical protein AF112_08150, partial [Listeria monocytogenes]|nr:hypothetical protein [Listeria monocytogenes]EAF5966666.1 hypothetical protein [Listeria monocytogenes]